MFKLCFDLSPGADNALPGKAAVALAQQTGSSSMVQRVAGRCRYLSIGGHLALGDGQNHAPHCLISGQFGAGGFL